MVTIFQTTLTNAFSDENVRISVNISLNYVPYGPIDYKSALVQIMAWRRPGDKPLSEPMMVRIPTHICVTRPQWVNDSHYKTETVIRPLKFIMGIPIPITFFSEQSPWCLPNKEHQQSWYWLILTRPTQALHNKVYCYRLIVSSQTEQSCLQFWNVHVFVAAYTMWYILIIQHGVVHVDYPVCHLAVSPHWLMHR